MNQKTQYKKSFLGSAVLHVAVFLLLVMSLKFTPQVFSAQPDHAVQIVNAVTVDQNRVQKEMEKIKAEERAKKRAEIAHQKHLAALAHKAHLKRVQEQHRLHALKIKQEKLERARKIAEQKAAKKLEDMQHQMAATQKHLAELKKQSVATVKNNLKSTLEKSLERQLNAEQQQLNQAHAAQIQTIVDKYKALILNAIGQHWIIPKNIDKKLSTELLIQLAPGGVVLNAQISKSSGNAVLDRSIITAVRKASPLPVPKEKKYFEPFRELHLTVKPEGLIG